MAIEHRTETDDFRKNATAINEALLVAGLHQHELRAEAEKLNAQLCREIAERKLAEAALQEAKNLLARQAGDLERLVEERTETLRETIGELEMFSYSIAHDMRAPLRSMNRFSQILIEDYACNLDPKAQDFLQRISRSAHRLDLLIVDVLNYTKILGGKVVNKPVDLDRLMRDILDSHLEWQPPQAEIQIQGTLLVVLGSEALLTQCLSNLLSNAVKFVESGTASQVKVWSESNGLEVRVFIRDNGIGIASDKHARIFGMFERLNAAAAFEGTGIGLTIARKAMKRMGGEIGFDSESGQGSTFWIRLNKA